MTGALAGFDIEAELWRLVFLMVRVGAAFLAGPLFGMNAVPVQVRVALAGAIAVHLMVWTTLTPPGALMSVAGMAALVGEVVVGLAIGLVFQLVFAIPTLAAELIGGLMGLNFAQTIDPASGAGTTALGQLFTVLLAFLFVGLDLHLLIIALVVESYAAFPPGAAWLGPDRLEGIAVFGGQLFSSALLLALPIALILLSVNLMTAIVSRAAPALNLFSIGLPATFLAGMVALAFAAPLITDQMAVLLERMGATLPELLLG